MTILDDLAHFNKGQTTLADYLSVNDPPPPPSHPVCLDCSGQTPSPCTSFNKPGDSDKLTGSTRGTKTPRLASVGSNGELPDMTPSAPKQDKQTTFH